MIGPGLGLNQPPGSCRRWVPTDQVGLQTIWDPNVAASINAGAPVDGALITLVTDQRALANLTSIAAWAPVWKTNIIDGQAVARYTDLQANLTLRTGAGAITNTAFSTILFFKPSSLNVARTIWTASDGTDTSFLSTAPTPSIRVKVGGVVDDRGLGISWMPNAFVMIASSYDGTNNGNITYLNTAVVAATNQVNNDPGIASKARQWLIGSTAGIANPLQGDLAYATVIGGAITAKDVMNWYGWGKVRWPSLT